MLKKPRWNADEAEHRMLADLATMDGKTPATQTSFVATQQREASAKEIFERDLAAMAVDKPSTARVRAPRLPPANFGLAEQKRGPTLLATMPVGMSLEHALSHGFFDSVASKLAPGAHIEVEDHRLTWWALLRVSSCDWNSKQVTVQKLSYVETAPPVIEGGSLNGFSWEHQGTIDQFVIRRDADQKVMKKGLRTRQDVLHAITAEFGSSSPGSPVVGR